MKRKTHRKKTEIEAALKSAIEEKLINPDISDATAIRLGASDIGIRRTNVRKAWEIFWAKVEKFLPGQQVADANENDWRYLVGIAAWETVGVPV